MAGDRRNPFMKWYARDWRGDGALRMCGYGARGLWADLLSLMHDEGEPYGHLLINGLQPTSAQLARMLGGSAREIEGFLAELEDAGVFSRTEAGAIFSRRMVRDKAKADYDRENGKGGGNPRLKKKVKGGVNPPDKGLDKAHIPDTRDQIPTNGGNDFFGEWYEAYPRHIGRGQAERAYHSALKKTDAATLLDGARRAAETYADTEPEFIPHPATWLNGERWLDERPPPAKRKPAEFN